MRKPQFCGKPVGTQIRTMFYDLNNVTLLFSLTSWIFLQESGWKWRSFADVCERNEVLFRSFLSWVYVNILGEYIFITTLVSLNDGNIWIFIVVSSKVHYLQYSLNLACSMQHRLPCICCAMRTSKQLPPFQVSWCLHLQACVFQAE